MEQFILELAPPPAPAFDNYVVGHNAAALAAVQALVDDRLPHRFVYLWGARGAGKTHLLRAAVAALTGSAEQASYAAADFLEFPLANHGVIAVDDLHRLPPQTGQQWFEALTHAAEPQARWLLAAEVAPRHLALRDDLRTRFASGVIFELAPLSEDETRDALKHHADARRIPVTGEVIDYLLRRAPRDVGSQLALLDALDRFALSNKRALTVPLARLLLQQLEPDSRP